MPNSPDSRGRSMTRRDFSRRAAVTAAGLLVAGVAAKAEDTAMPPARSAGAVQPVSNADVVERVLTACPALPASDRQELEGQVKSALELAASLRALHVPDGAEPDFVFRAGGPDHAR